MVMEEQSHSTRKYLITVYSQKGYCCKQFYFERKSLSYCADYNGKEKRKKQTSRKGC